jgi:hypothetical protein
MRWLPGPESRAAIVQHPVILAGLAVVALLALTAGVLVVIDSAQGEDAPTPQVQVEPQTTATAGPTAKTAIAGGMLGRTLETTAVRIEPGRASVLGTLPRGSDVQVDGRTEDSGWLRILFPPRSEFHGWVEAESIELTGEATLLSIREPEPPELVNLPTEIPVPPTLTPSPEELTPVEGTATPDGTPEPGLPDLVIGSPVSISGGTLYVTVINQGAGEFTGDLVVAVFNRDETALLGGVTLPGFTLEPGRSIDVGTGYAVTEDQTLVLIVDPNGDIDEVDNTNNRSSVAISVGAGGGPPDVPPGQIPDEDD